MRMLLVLSLLLPLSTVANAARGLKINTAKVAADHKVKLAELERDFSPEAVAAKRAMLFRGHAGYVYGDAGSVMNLVRDVNQLGKEAGAKPVSKALERRVSESGLLVSLQHGLVNAQHHKNGRLADALL